MTSNFMHNTKKTNVAILSYDQNGHFWAILVNFGPNENFPQKYGCVTSEPLQTPNLMQNIRKN